MWNNQMLNRKKFEDKFYKDIENGILIKFQKLYSNNKILIKYKLDEIYNIYKFFIYIHGKTFSKKNYDITDNNVFIDSFNNLDSIKLFATKYNLNDFNKEYNDYSEENYIILKNEINKLVKEYSQLGIVFSDITIEKYKFRISFYHPKYSELKFDFFDLFDEAEQADKYIEQVIFTNLNISPISKTIMNDMINSVKKSLEYFVKNSIANKLEK